MCGMWASINASYELPFGPKKHFRALAESAMRWRAAGRVNSIVTLQGGFPFTPQLSYNPSNSGDTRNPVRPFVNPAFTGPVILGTPNQWFNPAAFLAPPNTSGFYGNLGRDTLIGPGLATWDLSFLKDTPHSREAQPAVSRGVLQPPEPREFQYAQCGRVSRRRGFRRRPADHQHVDHVAADSVRPETALVTCHGPSHSYKGLQGRRRRETVLHRGPALSL